MLVSDGAANVPSDLAASCETCARRGCRLHVGVGSAARQTDAELVRVSVPRRVLVGSSAQVEAFVRLTGYGATKVLVGVSEDGRAVRTEEFSLRGAETEAVRLEIVPTTPGTHRYTFEITPLDGELTVENNRREALVEVVEGPRRVLYVEGEPRWEHGKMRAALGRNEKQVELVSVLRSARTSLPAGRGGRAEWPRASPAEEELSPTSLVSAASRELLPGEQLRAVELSSRRGGGCLRLGGRLAFEGQVAGTPSPTSAPRSTARAGRPKTITPSTTSAHGARARTPSRAAEDRASVKNLERPPIGLRAETFGGVKPGATVLVEARRVRAGGGRFPLAHQRYGARQRSR